MFDLSIVCFVLIMSSFHLYQLSTRLSITWTITKTGRVLSDEHKNNNKTQGQKNKLATQDAKKKNKIKCFMPWRKPCQEIVASMPGKNRYKIKLSFYLNLLFLPVQKMLLFHSVFVFIFVLSLPSACLNEA